MPNLVADNNASDHSWLLPIEFGSREEERHREEVAQPVVWRRSAVLQLAPLIVVPGGFDELGHPSVSEVCPVQHRCPPFA
jgi:hypothetical protein